MVKTKKQIIKLKNIRYNFESTSFDLSFKDKEKKKKLFKILILNY